MKCSPPELPWCAFCNDLAYLQRAMTSPPYLLGEQMTAAIDLTGEDGSVIRAGEQVAVNWVSEFIGQEMLGYETPDGRRHFTMNPPADWFIRTP